MSKRKDISPVQGHKEKKMNFLASIMGDNKTKTTTNRSGSTHDLLKEVSNATKTLSRTSLYESTNDLLASASSTRSKLPSDRGSTSDILKEIRQQGEHQHQQQQQQSQNQPAVTSDELDPALAFAGNWHGLYIDSIILDIVTRDDRVFHGSIRPEFILVDVLPRLGIRRS